MSILKLSLGHKGPNADTGNVLEGYIRAPGSAHERGSALGRVLAAHLDNERALNVDPARVRGFERLLAETAPHWLEEAAAFAKAASLPLEQLLYANCKAQEPNRFYMGGCTSVLALGDDCADYCGLLLKVRDEAPLPQYTGLRDSDRGRCLWGTNSGNLGYAHARNEHGLAIANNTGSPINECAPAVCFGDCHLLRLIVERANDCGEALEVFAELHGRNLCGTAGYRKGMIFLMMDIGGMGLIIEASPAKWCHRFVESGRHVYSNHFLLPQAASFTDRSRDCEVPLQSSKTRYQRGVELVEGEALTLQDLKTFSRDKANGRFSICNDSDHFPWKTISSWIHRTHNGTSEVHFCNRSPALQKYDFFQWD